jgi:RimJ/RimL family protein N-acetyltransferase
MSPDLKSTDSLFPDLTRDDVFRIETKRLWLRWPRVQDAVAIARLAGDKDVADMVGILPHPFPSGEGEKLVFEARKANAVGSQVKFALTDRRKPDLFMGIAGSRILSSEKNGNLRASFGYWLGKPYWGQGYATEAAHGLIDAIFAYTDVTELESSIRVINPASRRVAEKCGFQFIGSDMWDAPALKSRVAVDRFLLSRSTWTSLKGWREPNIQADRSEKILEACA